MYIDQHLIGYQSVEPNFSETNRKIQNAQMC